MAMKPKLIWSLSPFCHYRRLVDDPDSIMALAKDDEVVFARFIAAQRLRTPAFANQVDNMRRPSNPR
jgi:hypothetical protein